MAENDAQAKIGAQGNIDEERSSEDREVFFDSSDVNLDNVDDVERTEREDIRYKLEDVGVKWDKKWSTVEARRRLQRRLDAIRAESAKEKEDDLTAAASGAPPHPVRTDQGDQNDQSTTCRRCYQAKLFGARRSSLHGSHVDYPAWSSVRVHG